MQDNYNASSAEAKAVDTGIGALPSVEELRSALKKTESSDIRRILSALFDEATFSELGVYTKRHFSEFSEGDDTFDLEGVIYGYGAIDGRLVYAFGQDLSRKEGAMDERHAEKILALYRLAIKNNAPVVGIFNSTGADIFDGVSALAGYGRIMKSVTEASGKIPQIAIIAGECTGTLASLASMFDLIIGVRGAAFYVNNTGDEAEEHTWSLNTAAMIAKDAASAAQDARLLLSYLPSHAGEGVLRLSPIDSINRMLGNPDFGGNLGYAVRALADNGIYQEITAGYAPDMLTAFAVIGGIRCGVLGNRLLDVRAKLGSKEAKKAARFLSLCDAFQLPVITFVDAAGLAEEKEEGGLYASALASLAFAYAKAETPKITIILGSAIGGAFVLMGSKAMGADVVYALDTAEIGPMTTEASVAFVWNNKVSLDTGRDELEALWRASLSSPVSAAFRGEVDDIISLDEMRQKVVSSLYMLADKGLRIEKRHPVLPL